MENKAQESTITYNKLEVEKKAHNIYEAIAIIGKRSEQIAQDIKTELLGKLDEYASHTDTLDEVFENREQIEVSKYYEKLPKSTSIALSEWLNDEIYFRREDEK